MSIIKKGRLINVDAINTKPSSTISTPNALIQSDNSGKIDTNLLKMDEIIPPGTVVAYAGSTAPNGWLLCDGSAVSRTVYANLFAAIGTAHGVGDNSTTFNLPDYRGRFLRMVDGTAGRDPNKTSRTAMGTGGNTGNSVGSVQGDATAKKGLFLNDPGHIHGISITKSVYDEGLGDDADVRRYDAPLNGTLYTHSSTTNITINSSDLETRPINAYVNYIIKT